MSDDEPEKEIPELPWTIEADLLQESGQSFRNRLEDLVIFRYLLAGDTQPLAWFLLRGYTPSAHLLKKIGVMLEPGSAPAKKVPFALVSKSRVAKRGRPKKGPEQELRDWLIYCKVAQLIQQHGSGSYEAAITEVAGYDGLKRITVKRAYDTIKRELESRNGSE